jgi:ABC-type Mn2+/Zn2+ transport system permease subunit
MLMLALPDIPALTAHEFAESMQTWLFLGFLASFAGKGANVACAYMASRCACRGTNRRIDDPGRVFC